MSEARDPNRERAERYGAAWGGAIVKAQNADAEASILGGILLRNEVLAMLGELETDHFYDPRHKAVFAAVRALEALKQPIDTVTVESRLEADGKLDAIGGVAFLGDLAMRVPTPSNVEAYAKIVRDHAITRATLLTCSRAGSAVTSEALAGEELLDEMIAELARIDRPHARQEMTIASVVDAQVTAINAWMTGNRDESTLPRIPWGIASVDAVIDGAPIGQVAVIGARPGVGKTLWFTNFGMRTDEPGVVLTNEDDPEQDLAVSFLAWQAKVDTRRLYARELSQAEWQDVARAHAVIRNRTHVRLERAAGWTWRDCERRIRFLFHKFGIRWFALDYLQQLQGDPKEKRTYQIQAACEGAQRLCADLRIAGMISSQITRPEKRSSDGRQQPAAPARPTMHELKDSSAIESCAKQIILLHPNADKPQGQIEALIPKVRRAKAMQVIDLECDYRYAYLGDLEPGARTAQQAWLDDREAPHHADGR